MDTARTTPLPQDYPHQNRDKMPNLDGIRALACLFVIISHMPWPGSLVLIGPVGVGVFFVLRWIFDGLSLRPKRLRFHLCSQIRHSSLLADRADLLVCHHRLFFAHAI